MGWTNSSVIDAGLVDSDSFVRGKFYISASNDISDPVNKVPNFRLRLSQGSVTLAENHYEYAATGTGGVSYEPAYDSFNDPETETSAGLYLQPSRYRTTPSLYRVDLDPVDVPLAQYETIGAAFESYSNQNPANGTVSLQEVVVGTYPKLEATSDTEIFEYDRGAGLNAGAGGSKTFNGGAFNMENDFQAGRLQDLFFTPSNQMANVGQTTGGIVLDTLPVPNSVFGEALSTVKSTYNSDAPRLKSEKIYMARYYATSSVPTYSSNTETTRQGTISFKLQTAHNVVSAYLQLVGATKAGAANASFASQVLPGLGSQNPETSTSLETSLATPGEDGGWYILLLSTPLDPDIRADNGDLGLLGSASGQGSYLPSAKDIILGVDVQSYPRNLKLSPTFTANGFFDANRAQIRVSRMELHEFDQIDDGGYGYPQ